MPDDEWCARRIAKRDVSFPPDWNAHPVGISSVTYGRDWLIEQAELVLVVPSVALPSEENILLNPRHAAYGRVTARVLGRLDCDHRLFAPLVWPALPTETRHKGPKP